tara:strand:+ start:658 stop:819 length:162 start_codon:yes stop_codon:yes gene_type:complete
MIKKIIALIRELFRKKPKKQSDLEKVVEDHKKRLKEIQDEKHSTSDIVDHFNK